MHQPYLANYKERGTFKEAFTEASMRTQQVLQYGITIANIVNTQKRLKPT